MTRFINYYRLEWGHDAAPSDPKAPPSRRDGWPATPQSIPPMPFTEWPYGGATAIGVTRPNSVDSPLMDAIGNTAVGQWMNDAHIQVYGWVNAGGNLSNNTVRGGNCAGGLRLQPEHGSARSGRGLYRATARHSPEGPHRLGLPHRADLRRELSLHHGLRPVRAISSSSTTATTATTCRWPMARSSFRISPTACCSGSAATSRSGHRGAARAEQLHVYALDDVHVRQLYEHRHSTPRSR